MVSSLYFLDEKKVFTYPSLRQLDITTGVGERNGSESWYAYRHKCKLLDGKAKEKKRLLTFMYKRWYRKTSGTNETLLSTKHEYQSE
tara:strand:- start:8077 stop:8337 length:261 start_codon:yes stop_codon:yes gene_type:complete